ncbi:MAG: hypothetical protein AAFP90_08210 [Planctomycetota bacterium]
MFAVVVAAIAIPLIFGFSNPSSLSRQVFRVTAILYIVGILLIIFGIADFCLFTFAGMDITGVSWSPIAAGITGGIVMRIAGAIDGDDD